MVFGRNFCTAVLQNDKVYCKIKRVDINTRIQSAVIFVKRFSRFFDGWFFLFECQKIFFTHMEAVHIFLSHME